MRYLLEGGHLFRLTEVQYKTYLTRVYEGRTVVLGEAGKDLGRYIDVTSPPTKLQATQALKSMGMRVFLPVEAT